MGERLKFTPEEIIKARNRKSRWAGSSKYFTKDCPGCLFHLSLENGIETCEWGEVWKKLVPRPRGQRACPLLKSSIVSPREEIILKKRKFSRR